MNARAEIFSQRKAVFHGGVRTLAEIGGDEDGLKRNHVAPPPVIAATAIPFGVARALRQQRSAPHTLRLWHDRETIIDLRDAWRRPGCALCFLPLGP